MPDGMLNEAEFENEMKEMSDRQLIEFTARQVFGIHTNCKKEDIRIKALESRDKKTFGLSGGAGAVFGGIMVAIIDYFTKKSGG